MLHNDAVCIFCMSSLCLHGISLGSWAFSHRPNTCLWAGSGTLSGRTLGVYVNGFMSLVLFLSGLAISCWHAEGVTLPSPHDNWAGLQQLQQTWVEKESGCIDWMNWWCLFATVFFIHLFIYEEVPLVKMDAGCTQVTLLLLFAQYFLTSTVRPSLEPEVFHSVLMCTRGQPSCHLERQDVLYKVLCCNHEETQIHSPLNHCYLRCHISILGAKQALCQLPSRRAELELGVWRSEPLAFEGVRRTKAGALSNKLARPCRLNQRYGNGGIR